MLPFEKHITKLEKETGKKFKSGKFNIDKWIFDDFARFELNEKKEIIKLKINDAEIKKIPEIIFDIESLEELSLENNKITEIGDNIKKLKKLRFLNLSYNKIEKFPEELFSCKKLEILILTEE